MFKDREEAGRLLAERLAGYRGVPACLVLALPRGGVAVAYPIGRALGLPLDVFITRKLGAPGDPEYAIGAVAETGGIYLNPRAREVLDLYHVSDDYLEHAVHVQQQEIARRQTLYRFGRPVPILRGRTILLIDDGIATGATFLASVQALKTCGLHRLVAAIPVGPIDILATVARHVDELVVLEQPEWFCAVGNHYVDFTQVDDHDVLRYLQAAAEDRHGGHRTTVA